MTLTEKLLSKLLANFDPLFFSFFFSFNPEPVKIIPKPIHARERKRKRKRFQIVNNIFGTTKIKTT